MATLRERVDSQLLALQAERTSIEARYAEALAEIDAKIVALTGARALMTPQLQQAYAALLRFGLIREI